MSFPILMSITTELWSLQRFLFCLLFPVFQCALYNSQSTIYRILLHVQPHLSKIHQLPGPPWFPCRPLKWKQLFPNNSTIGSKVVKFGVIFLPPLYCYKRSILSPSLKMFSFIAHAIRWFYPLLFIAVITLWCDAQVILSFSIVVALSIQYYFYLNSWKIQCTFW